MQTYVIRKDTGKIVNLYRSVLCVEELEGRFAIVLMTGETIFVDKGDVRISAYSED